MKTDTPDEIGILHPDAPPPTRGGRRLAAALTALALAAAGVSFAVIAFEKRSERPPAATSTQQNGMIALDAGDPLRITVVDPDGTGARQITTGNEPDPRAQEHGYFEEFSPQWSQDGTDIAFIRWYDSGASLCLIGVDGTGFQIVVPDFDGAVQLGWSPDEATFVYYSSRDETIHLVDADGSNDRVLTGLPSVPSGQPPNWLPTWSPDSSRIAFTSKDLWTIRPDGTDLTQLTDLSEGEFAFDPSWSPDGSSILFTVGGWETDAAGIGGAQRAGALYTVGTDGSNLTRITNDDRFWWGADWSPDGLFIVSMERTPNDVTDLVGDAVHEGVYVMAADGTDAHLLGNGLWGTPVWGPAPAEASPSTSGT
jgi:Tol biopolymer transport system component